ncbi:E3 ubiquitin-protein ligase HECTD2 [Pseudohyphozyma bogoriensis]|nr:E3 ubiquitin-protein ligase HECTD2 [Pseudohyphozyma bogoriensis]
MSTVAAFPASSVRTLLESLSSPTPPHSDDDPEALDPESLLHDLITTCFSSTRALDANFREPSSAALPSLKLIASLYGAIKSRPAAIEIANLPPPLQSSFVRHLSQPAYSKPLLSTKIDLVIAFISLRLNHTLTANDGSHYATDWGIKAGAKVGALLFAANQIRPRVPLEAFYATLIDALDPTTMIQAFEQWETHSQSFTLCQYPFLLSLGTKMGLLSYENQREMGNQARDALRTTVFTRTLVQPYLILRVRRAYLVQDSLRELSNQVTSLKKSLRVVFEGEEGVDAGGVRKEWLLTLSSRLFDVQYGMFTFDDTTSLCWFNPASTDSLDEYYLIGAVLGLAIYNSVTLDVPLPLAVYKKLKHEKVGLEDLEVFNPELVRGLKQLLEFEGDVEEVFCRSWVGEWEAYGEVQSVELCEGGRDKMVTNANRKEFVTAYVDFLLNSSIQRQFDAFAHGFAEVTSGNAFSLVKGEEVELLVRGSRENLDVEQLKAITVYEGFYGEEDQTIRMFWDVVSSWDPERQRKLLSFITGSDRIPATGHSALTLKITCMPGNQIGRYPTSHTCFNQLCLWRYPTREMMEQRLVTAMEESEGFDLK